MQPSSVFESNLRYRASMRQAEKQAIARRGAEFVRFEPWFDLSAPLEKYTKTGNLTEFEVSMDQMIVAKFLPRFPRLI